MNTSTTQPSQATASWVEHQMLEHIKGALRVAICNQSAGLSPAQLKSSMAFVLKSFQRHLERLMQIEESGGYMHAVIDAKPNMAERLKQLRCDHDHFRYRVQELSDRIDRLEDWQTEELEKASREIAVLLSEVDSHDAAEVSLLQETLLFDEGGEG